MPGATGPFTGRLGFGRLSALVVVDMVRAYTDLQYPLYIGPHAPEVVAAIVSLVEAARAAGIPVVYTGVRYEPGGADGGIFFRKVPPLALFVGESDAGRLVPELSPRADEPLILKQYASAFWCTSLAPMLHARGVDTVILAGVSTSGCIRASATDAMQHGFIPIVVREAVGDRNVGPHEANLFDIAAKIGDVVSLEEALAICGRRQVPGNVISMSATVREEQQQAVEEITEVAPGILRLQLPIQMPGLGHVNCYLLEDERGFAVVDPGLPGDASWAALTAGFKRAGVPLARVHTVVVTHSHPDHFGGAGPLRAETGADIVSHRLFRLMFSLETGEEHADTNPEQLAEDDQSGNPLSKTVRFGSETPWGSTPYQPMSEEDRAKFLGMGRRIEPTPTVRLDEADHIMLAGRRWVAIHTPGHTIDHLCLFDPQEGVLLSGDHVLPTITPHISGMIEGSDPLDDYFGSLRKVAALTGVKHVLPAHGHPFVELSKRCDGIIEHHRERLTRLSHASAEMDRPGTVNDYMKFLFRERSWGSMAESETYAHLEHLRIAGQASCERHEGQLEYTVQHPLRPIDD